MLKTSHSIDLSCKYQFQISLHQIFCQSMHEIKSHCHSIFLWILQNCENNSFGLGDILCFFSSYTDCQSFLQSCLQYESSKYHFLKFQFDPKIPLNNFYQNLSFQIESFLRSNSNFSPIFILPFCLSQTITRAEINLIGQNFPENLKQFKILKLITATTYVESSIPQLPNLFCLIDLGLHKFEYFDPKTNITIQTEKLISGSKRFERRNRIGQYRNGLFIYYNLELTPRFSEESPEIIRVDLTSHLLRFRQIDIKLEDIQNLPTIPNRYVFPKLTTMLTQFQIFDSEGKTTDFGKDCAQFSILSPYFASALLNFARNDIFNLVFGSLVLFIITSEYSLISDPNNVHLIDNFCSESDIITILKTFIHILESFPDDKQFNFFKYGLHQQASQIVFNKFSHILTIYSPD
jgi:hypothetical protein